MGDAPADLPEPGSPGPQGEPPAPEPPRRRREGWLARLLRGGLAALLGLVFLLVLALGWLGGSDAGLRTVAALADRAGGSLLVLDKPEGYLFGRFRLAALHVHLPTLQLDIRDLAVDWRPAALLSGTLEVASLAAAELSVATLPSDEPATLPASLEIPLAVHLEHLHLARLRIGKLIDGTPAEPDLEMTALEGALTSDGRSHHLTGLKAVAPFGSLAAEARIDGRSPFPLKLGAELNTLQAGETYQVHADASGDLQTLQLLARGSGAGFEGQATIAATPFAALPFKAARIAIKGLDPARFHADAPAAVLDIDMDLEPSSPRPGAGVEEWILTGPLRVTNRKPGSYDLGRLPLESLVTQLRWAGGELAATDLDVRVPGKGRGAGSASWHTPGADAKAGDFGRVDADLRITGLDLKSLDRRLPASRIVGPLTARADAEAQTVDADLRDPQITLRLKARQAGGVVTVSQLLATARAARVEASGKAALDGKGAFEAKGSFSHFDPRAFFSTAPPADLNSTFTVEGQRSPRLAAKLQLDLGPSSLEGKALGGGGRLAIDGTALTDADLALNLAGNQLSAKGRWGKPGDALNLHLDAPALAALGHGLGGRARLDAVLRGSAAQPAGEFELLAEHVAAGGVLIDGVNGRGSLAEGGKGRVSVLLAIAGLRTGADKEALVRRASFTLDGSRAAHTARLDAFGDGEVSGTVTLAGGLLEGGRDGLRWQGQLEKLAVRGGYTINLIAPSSLQLSRTSVILGPTELRGGGGGLYRFEETRWAGGEVIARGRLTGVQVGLALDPNTRAVKSGGDSLQMGGEWDVHVGREVNGFMRFYREKGDLVLLGDSPVQLGLDELQLTVSAAANRLAFGFSTHGSRLGQASGAGTALAERTADGSVRLVPFAPLLGSAHIDIPSIAWAGPLADQNLKTEGSLKGDFTLSGTPARPETEGRIRGDKLGFSMADQGLHLSGGTLVADFNRDRLHLGEFSFVSPNQVKPRESRIEVARLTKTPGTLTATGEVQLASGEGAFSFKAERLPLLQRPDQWLVLSGEGEILTGWNSATIEGRLFADAGLVELSRTPAPSLGDDVEVLDPARSSKAGAKPFHVAVDLAIGLGDALYVKALGLDTRLAGDLRLRSGDGQPLRATGVINTLGGVYEGYGQKLSIERGIVTFSGSIENPGLNVVALRKGLAVEAGVAISGTARRPIVKLVSDPNVPDPEKLGWIVLGRPPDQGSGGELALLLPAAQALLGVGPGLSSGLAGALGFDELSFGAGVDSRTRVQTSSVATGSVTGTASSASSSNIDSVPGQVITIGKRLSSRALLSFEQSVTGTSSIVKLSYQLTRRIAVIGRAGSENAVDAVFSLSFR